jgi:hypothetical protein
VGAAAVGSVVGAAVGSAVGAGVGSGVGVAVASGGGWTDGSEEALGEGSAEGSAARVAAGPMREAMSRKIWTMTSSRRSDAECLPAAGNTVPSDMPTRNPRQGWASPMRALRKAANSTTRYVKFILRLNDPHHSRPHGQARSGACAQRAGRKVLPKVLVIRPAQQPAATGAREPIGGLGGAGPLLYSRPC